MREEIAKDKAERAAREKAAKAEGGAAAAPTTPQSQPQSSAPQAKREYDTCRLQVRLYSSVGIRMIARK